MSVRELNENQLDVLRQQYNYDVNDSTSYVDRDDIPDHVLFTWFDGITFTPADFACI